MKLFAFLTICGSALMLLCANASDAQTPDVHPPSTESVTVTGQKAPPEAVIKGFVQSYAASAPALGKMAKWARGICPATTGLPSTYNLFLTNRVRDVAAMAGAPLLNPADCKPNIDIVFTRQPQALLDRIRVEHPVLLGFHYQAEAEKIAAVRYPIQAWYTTETEDEHGSRQIDNPQDSHGSDLIMPPNPLCMAGCTLHLPYARTVHVTASRISDSLSSQFFHVIVVIDLDKISGQEIGSLADDIAVMALAQPQSFDACLTPPSIANLMTAGCADKPKAVTPLDLAYLRGLYRLNTNAGFCLAKSPCR